MWRGGAVTDLHVKMKVNSFAKLARGEELRTRLLELARTGVPDDEIAKILTREGHHSPHCEEKVLPITVQRLRLAAGIKVKAQRNRCERPAKAFSLGREVDIIGRVSSRLP